MKEGTKVLLVGSGLTAPLAREFDLTGWTVVVVNNAWQVLPDRWDILLHGADFPEDNKPPTELRDGKKLIDPYVWVYEKRKVREHAGFWIHHAGYAKSIMFTAIWWILENLNPELIGFIGCDMHYPEGNRNTFYGKGTPDPMRHGAAKLLRWLGFIDGFCVRDDVMLINYSPKESPSMLPFVRGEFPNEKHIGADKYYDGQYRTEKEFFKETVGVNNDEV